MITQEKKRRQEKETVALIIDLYFKGNHHQKAIREECEALKQYAYQRIDHCPFMETKTFCSACKIHCYSFEQREKIRNIMRYSEPRMLLYHPIKAIHHLLITIKEKRKK